MPILDAGRALRAQALIDQRQQDLALQGQRAARQREIEAVERQQLAELERIMAALSGTASGGTISDLETAGSIPASDPYGADDPNPAAARLFGDAALSVEELIVEVARETYGLAGVRQAGLSPLQWRCLLQALIWQESRLQIGARSPVGAFGLTQIMPGTARDLGIYPAYYESPHLQVEGGARYLAQMLGMFGGDVVLALAAYNAGPGNVQDHGGVPPFAETRHYVQVIPAKYNQYLAQIGGPDALGTIEPALVANAHFSLTADATALYGNHTRALAGAAAERLHEILSQVRSARDVQEASALNAYARAELARLLVLSLRLQAAHLQTISAGQMATAAAVAQERRYLDLTLRSLE